MNKINKKILDCTLRDGGYYTDWNFSSDFLNNYLLTIKALPISNIEIGYISDNKDNLGPFYHLDEIITKNVKSKIRKDQKLFAMVNFKEVKNSKHLQKLLDKKTKYLDGIRFAIDPKNIISFNKLITNNKIKNLDLNLNLMYLSEWYNNDKLIKDIFKNLPKKIKILSFVDSYGAMDPFQIKLFFEKIKRNYSKTYNYGCHFHNNCGLALANSITAMNINCSVVDTTFTGMGRGAGNAETELLLAFDENKRKLIKGFSLNNFIEIMKPLKVKYGWGSSFAYSLAAKKGYSQGEMMNLLQKRRLDPATALEVLSTPKNNKVVFKNFKIPAKKMDKKLFPILIGGGDNQIKYGNFLYDKISKKNILIFSSLRSLINYSKLKKNNENCKILISSGNDLEKYTSFFIKSLLKKIDYMVVEENFVKKISNYFPTKKIILSNTIAKNPLFIAGLMLKKNKINNLYLAFFDGNPKNEQEYIIMEETLDSLKKLSKESFNFYSITKNFLKIPYVNPWLND
ncbi:hypothetical protein OAA82_02335 [Pelagibacteraceae bacterium]|nr:hypothetical protein [Pelagibacteraceae bacterium]